MQLRHDVLKLCTCAFVSKTPNWTQTCQWNPPPYLFSDTCFHSTVLMANFNLFSPLSFSPSPSKIKALWLFQKVRHGIKWKVTNQVLEWAHKENKDKNFFKTIQFLFRRLPPNALLCREQSLLRYLASSRTIWNTWFNRDTFSVTLPPRLTGSVKLKIDYLLFCDKPLGGKARCVAPWLSSLQPLPAPYIKYTKDYLQNPPTDYLC